VFTASEESLARVVEERVLARLNDPGVCTEVPITAPAYRVDLRERPRAGRGRLEQLPRPRQPRRQIGR
jgi:hypothetical protein